jgi:hypothetical protein
LASAPKPISPSTPGSGLPLWTISRSLGSITPRSCRCHRSSASRPLSASSISEAFSYRTPLPKGLNSPNLSSSNLYLSQSRTARSVASLTAAPH